MIKIKIKLIYICLIAIHNYIVFGPSKISIPVTIHAHFFSDKDQYYYLPKYWPFFLNHSAYTNSFLTPRTQYVITKVKVQVKWSRYTPGVAQMVGRCIALFFHDRGTGRRWVVSSTPRQHFTPGKDPVPIFKEAGWSSGPVWKGGKSRPHQDSIPDRSARSQSLYRSSYPAHHYKGRWNILGK